MMYMIGMQAEEGIGEYGQDSENTPAKKVVELQPDEAIEAEQIRLRQVADSLSVEELSVLWNDTKDMNTGEPDVVSEMDVYELTPLRSRYDFVRHDPEKHNIALTTDVKSIPPLVDRYEILKEDPRN